jgi:ATP-binding cassette subfamily B protein
MIAHRLSTVVNADKIIVLNEGRLEEEGSHNDLIRSEGLYARMWKEYNQAVKWRISAESEVK